MSDRVHVATRKGLFDVVRGKSGWTITETAFLGDPVTMVLHDARDGTTYAALNLGHFGVKLHRRDPGGDWREIAVPAYDAEPDDDNAPSVRQIWSLEPGGDDRPGVLWAGTLPGGLFRSDDRGETWRLNTPLWERPERESWFGGGYDVPGIHSISVDPRNSRHLAVGVSCGGVWTTENDGGTWECKTKGMYAVYMPPDRREDPAVQDPHRLVRCNAQPDALWVQHHNGVFRSTDNAATWSDVDTVEPSVFGFAVAVHPDDAGTAWLVPAVKDECRIPVEGKVVVARTRDGGKSFDVLNRGLPQEHAYDLVFRHALDVDGSGDRLVMGSTTGGLWISEDQGDRWTAVSTHLPPIYCTRFTSNASSASSG
jgi:hypothetical protein